MKRRAYIVGVLVAGVLTAAGLTAPAYCRVVSSAHRFQQNFRDLKKAETMSPIERFVFSLVLANSKAPKAEASKAEGPAGDAARVEAPKAHAGNHGRPFGRT